MLELISLKILTLCTIIGFAHGVYFGISHDAPLLLVLLAGFVGATCYPVAVLLIGFVCYVLYWLIFDWEIRG